MNNEMIIAQMKEICRSGGPEGKREFFRELRARGLLHRRPVAMSHGEFLVGQLFYIEKWVWVGKLSICTDTAACCRNSRGNRKILPVENGRAGICCQIFIQEHSARENVSCGPYRYGRSSDRHLCGPVLPDILPHQGVFIHDGAVPLGRFSRIFV